ncbi:hypothetical protein IEO70_17750 [Bacillus sp. AGMB 02131]|uniref:Uncharacterized protein n=2 Tax=Peribacillus faecalis TaxID=2772559 RepID=A0A927HBW1_9BACI|nr:hypothetical protein [Peribacillus faecalis]
MAHSPEEIKNELILNLLVQVLEEHGIISEKELQERLTNQIKLSAMNEVLKEKVIHEIQTH